MLAIGSWNKTKFPWYEEVTMQKDFSINEEGKTSFTLLFDRNMQERAGGLTAYPVLVKMWVKICTWCSGKCYDIWILEWENWRGRHKTHPRLCLFWPTQIFLDSLLEIFWPGHANYFYPINFTQRSTAEKRTTKLYNITQFRSLSWKMSSMLMAVIVDPFAAKGTFTQNTN